jgi:hypothetical protein
MSLTQILDFSEVAACPTHKTICSLIILSSFARLSFRTRRYQVACATAPLRFASLGAGSEMRSEEVGQQEMKGKTLKEERLWGTYLGFALSLSGRLKCRLKNVLNGSSRNPSVLKSFYMRKKPGAAFPKANCCL